MLGMPFFSIKLLKAFDTFDRLVADLAVKQKPSAGNGIARAQFVVDIEESAEEELDELIARTVPIGVVAAEEGGSHWHKVLIHALCRPSLRVKSNHDHRRPPKM
jgi:hypothetical protein